MTADEDPFGGPTPSGTYPGIAGLEGRLLLLIPHKVEEVPSNFNAGQMTQRLEADVVVFDGPQICEWVKVTNNGRTQTPMTFDLGEDPATSGGVKLRDMWISNGPLIKACADALDPDKRVTMTLGRLTTKPTKYDNDAWVLSEPTEDDAKIARKYTTARKVDPFA